MNPKLHTPLAAALGVLLISTTCSAVVVNVSTPSGLLNAVNSASTGDEIVIAPGTYNMPLVIDLDVPGVTLRGATGNRDDVILRGGGVDRNVSPRTNIFVQNRDITIRDLTVSEAYYNGIHLKGETNLIHNTLISNVKVENIGQRYIKGSRSSSSTPDIFESVTDLTIENSYLVQSKPYFQQPGELTDYIGGIDVMIAKNAVIRDNVFEGIRGNAGQGRGALFLWQAAENAVIERNVFVNNDRSIALGNFGSLPANESGVFDMDGAIVRNNTVVRGPGGDVGVELVHTKDVQFYNNTIYSESVNQIRTLSVLDHESRGSSLAVTTGLDIQNNIFRGHILDNAAGDWSASAIAAMGNIVDTSGLTVQPGWFADVASGDLHLTELGAMASGLAPRLSGALGDLDRETRLILTNYGADQAPVPEPSAIFVGLTLAAGVLLTRW